MSRVLIVHAEPAMGARLAAAMMEVALEAVVVTSGERAMDKFIQEPADVLVIDFDLEGRDGVTAAEAIRWMPGGRRARLVLTANEEPPDGDLESLAAGLDAYAVRVGPIDPRRIAEIAKRAAAVRPHEEQTRVLGAEQALLEAERMKAAASDGWRDASHDEPSRAVTLSASTELGELADRTNEDASQPRFELPDADGRKEGAEVERLVDSTRRATEQLAGTFQELGFTRVLSRLADMRATGALICVHPNDGRETTSGREPTKIVYFRAGVPAHVRSNVLRECLGQVLTRQRKIGPATLDESIAAVRRGEGRQGEVLVRMGAISPVELSEALAEQLRVKLFDLFFWEQGTFRFAPDRPPSSELIDLEMGLAEIAFRGVRLAVPHKKALELLAPFRDCYVIPRARSLVRFVRLEVIGPALRELIRRADGTRTVGELLDEAPAAGPAAQLLHAMECLDAIQFDEAPLRAIREPSGIARAPRPRAPAELDEDGPTSNDASDPALKPPPPRTDELSTFDQPAAPEAPSEPDTPREPIAGIASVPDEVLEEEWEAITASEEVRLDSAEHQAVEPGPDSLGSTAEEVSGLTSGETPASGEDSVDAGASEDSVSEELEVPRGRAGSGLREKPSESAEELERRLQDQLRAERLFRRGLRALDKDDPTKALESFEAAAALCPDEARFALYVIFGEHALAPEDPALRDRALERIEDACEEDPELTVGHLLRARLYTAAGREFEAERAYRRVLELEPANRTAKIELKALRKP